MRKSSPTNLQEYRKKRDPGRTNEPFGPEPPVSVGPTLGGAFVVHQHDATRMHWDLRIEIGGALESFAIPRGPSLDPREKRMAMRTEPHPLEYLDFEAVIPDGNYGAGPMICWDRGRVRYLEGSAEDGIARGKIDFELYGYKLRGRFGLIHTGGRSGHPQNAWLLVKKTDPWATPGSEIVEVEPRSVLSGLTVAQLEEAPRIAEEVERIAAELGAPRAEVDGRKMTPMLCAQQGAELAKDGWLYELKLDGVRILADRRGDDVALTYRKGRPAAHTYPEIARAVRALAARRVVLDGEIVAFDEAGKPTFQRLGRRIQAQRPRDVALAALATPVVYLVFDLLAIGARDLRGLPLRVRKELLRKLIPTTRGFIRVLDHLENDGRALYDLCTREKLEGIVAKKADSTYKPGPHRGGDWVKMKCERDDDFVVFGWTRGENARDRLGALDLATYDGNTLTARGKAGSGLGDETIATLLERFAPITVPKYPIAGPLERAPRGRTFVKPEIVVSVRYLGWSEDGRLRFPVFRGIREDVDPKECRAAPSASLLDTPSTDAPDVEDEPAPLPVQQKARVVLTNANKVFWPGEGHTKGDLFRYYDSIAPTILPYLRDRPIVLVRYPDGIAGKSFYQWNVPKGTPPWVRTTSLDYEEKPDRKVTGFLVDDVDTLLLLANLGNIPIHMFAAQADTLGFCDFFTIDFDLGEATLGDAITLARELKGILEEIGLEGFPKTSGQTGLHVLVPVGPGITFDAARTMGDILGRILERRHPKIATMERLKKKRGPRVLVDTGQTGRSRTIVAPYSVRATPGARVSTPLRWDEVGFALDPGRFTIFTVPDRIATSGDPMRPMLDARPDIPAAVEKLGRLL